MPAPKEQGRNPIKRVVKFVKKANMWLYAEHFNHDNTPDRMEWFNTEEEALGRYHQN